MRSKMVSSGMRLSPAKALDKLATLLMSDQPIDRHACRRLALRITGSFGDPSWAITIHQALCDIIEAHGEDPDHAVERFDFLRPVIESQMRASQ